MRIVSPVNSRANLILGYDIVCASLHHFGRAVKPGRGQLGVVKELDVPPATEQIRMRQYGTTDNDTTSATANETWLIFKE